MSPISERTALLHISTPEGVTFSLPLAGPVTRAIAFMIDLAAMMTINQIVNIAFTAVRVVFSDSGTAMMVLGQFILFFGYGSISELLLNGQTIGKKVMKIRVMDERGLRLRPSQVIIRNLLRIIDMQPMFFALGGIFCALSPRSQRVGDLAAGTVVVRTVLTVPPDIEGVMGGKYNSFRQHPHLEARLRQKVTPDEAQLALAALVRRDELEPDATVRLFETMAASFRTKVKFPDEAEYGLSDEQYVRNVVDSVYRRAAKV